jgi:GNAT superfamily N-acetyltransferase
MGNTENRVSRGAAGYGLVMVKQDMDQVPDWPPPAGYAFYPMRQDDIGLWVDIERDAEPYVEIDHRAFYASFGSDIQALGQRCFILQDDHGIGIGTVSAWYEDDFHGEAWGRVHWVALRKAYWGKGFGRVLASFVLKKLASKHDKAYLVTQSARIPAIHLYLKCGFVPLIDSEEGRIGWREVRENLDHRVLADLDRFEFDGNPKGGGTV